MFVHPRRFLAAAVLGTALAGTAVAGTAYAASTPDDPTPHAFRQHVTGSFTPPDRDYLAAGGSISLDLDGPHGPLEVLVEDCDGHDLAEPAQIPARSSSSPDEVTYVLVNHVAPKTCVDVLLRSTDGSVQDVTGAVTV